MDDVHFERDDLKVRLNGTTSKLSGHHNSLTVVHEPLEQHRGRSTTSHLRLESWFPSSIHSFAHKVTDLVTEEVSGHCKRLVEVVSPVSVSLQRDSPFIVDSLLAA